MDHHQSAREALNHLLATDTFLQGALVTPTNQQGKTTRRYILAPKDVSTGNSSIPIATKATSGKNRFNRSVAAFALSC